MRSQSAKSVLRGVLASALLALALTAGLQGCSSTEVQTPTTCSADSDCAVLDADGDLCNGTVRCDAGTCVVDSTAVSCPATGDCTVGQCVPASGACEQVAAPEDTVCDDGDACTQDGLCTAGTCTAGAAVCGDDDDPCTVVACTPGTGECTQSPGNDFEPCDDTDGCTINDACLAGVCNGSPRTCDEDDSPCTEATCISGACAQTASGGGEPCDDGDACTVASACSNGDCIGGVSACADPGPCQLAACDAVTGQCVFSDADDGSSCDAGDLCSVDNVCTSGVCGDGSAKCGDNPNPCLVDVCEPTTGACLAEAAPNSPPCTDGEPCTLSDVCVGGQCVGEALECAQDSEPCTVAQCAGGSCATVLVSEGSPCNDGQPCTINDACTAGACTSDLLCPDDGNGCTLESCDANGGPLGQPLCNLIDLPNGFACEDGNPCTQGDTCQDLACTSGGPTECPDDGDPCTQELCVAGGGCASIAAPEGASCEDGDACTAGETCQSGGCGGGGPTECADDGDDCTVATCDSVFGCDVEDAAGGTSCDDGDACTGDDICEQGECAGDAISCIPDGPCQAVFCDVGLGCQQSDLPNGIPCEDGDACTATSQCEDGQCLAGDPVVCDQPSNPCLIGFCLEGVGSCTTGPATAGTACTDGNPCTTADGCVQGTCTGGPALDCGPGPDGCIELTCNPANGVCDPSELPDGAACDENNPCRTDGTCSLGICSSDIVVICDTPDEPCVVAVCDPADGSCQDQPAPLGDDCQDGDPCTQNSLCAAAGCQGGSPAACADDGDTCSLEFCDPEVGCTFAAADDGIACDDASPCTEDTTCSTGVCGGGIANACPPDGDPCTSDACIAEQGCVYLPLPEGEPCDDGDACTADDACIAGSCAGTSEVTCDDSGDVCQPNVCDPATGACVPGEASAPTSCDDGNICTLNDVCQNGLCSGSPVTCAGDGDPCTVSVCDPALGSCVQGSAATGTSCDDGEVCTVSDVCDGAGGCAGADKDCPDSGAQCETGFCDPLTGDCSVVQSSNGAPCEDGDPCVQGDFCLQGACAPGTSPACVPSSPCVTVACNAGDGQCTETPLADAEPCDDADACTSGEACLAGECESGIPVDCSGSDAGPCVPAVCDPNDGQCKLTPLSDGALCDDGDACTEADTCDTATCAGVALTCDQGGDPCTVATCDPAQDGCVDAPLDDGTICEDGDVCTDADVCSGGSCVGATVVCPASGSDCQAAFCLDQVGCVSNDANEGGVCNDNACFVDGACSSGVCTGGTPLTCNDPNVPCFEATCSAATGCETVASANGTACEDGDACTDNTTCTDAACGGDTVQCPEPPACHVASCESGTGCTTAPAGDGTSCDDGNPCTLIDTCLAGSCQPGATKTCSGGTQCRPDQCDPATGACIGGPILPDGQACDDGSLCTVDDTCNGSGQCSPGAPVTCDAPANPCLQADCSPATGQCVEVANADGTPCDDGSLCTDPDTCEDGACEGTISVACSAPDECIYKACDPGTGNCVPSDAPEGSPCDDGDACNVGEACSEFGQCAGGSASPDCCSVDTDCDDGSPCTADTCSAGRCAYTGVSAPACVSRLVITRPDDAEVVIINPVDGSVVSTLAVPGAIEGLAGADAAGVALIALSGGATGIVVLDVLQPSEAPLAPAAGATTAVTAHADQIITVGSDGTVFSWDLETGTALETGPSLNAPARGALIDPATERLYVAAGNTVSALSTQPLAALPPGPWLLGGTPGVGTLDSQGERLFFADASGASIRVISAIHGTGTADLTGFGGPGHLLVDSGQGHLIATYPAANVLRTFALSDLAPDQAHALADAPTGVALDGRADRVYVTAAGSDRVDVLDRITLLPLGAPLIAGDGPVGVVVVHSQPGNIILSEAMIAPSGLAAAGGEWLELHNPGTATINLTGWTLDANATSHTLAGLSIPAGAHRVLCANGDPAANGGIACDYVWADLDLADDGVSLVLSDSSGSEVDRADLTSSVPTGQPLALRHPAYNNRRRYSWSAAIGTPGGANFDVADDL